MEIAVRLFRLSTMRLLAVGIRAVSMGGRLLFVSGAAFFLSLDDLGRFGVLASVQVLLTALVGLEIYQTVNRELASGLAGDEERRDYLAFAVVGAIIAGTLACGILAAMRWRGWELAAGAAIVASEHFGTELFRMLVIEKKSNAALYSFSLRSGFWAIALPLLTLLGVLSRHWSLALVLLSWAAASVAATLFVLVLPPAYRLTGRAFIAVPHWVWSKRTTVITWLLVAVSWRTLENGGRLIAANLLGYTAGGVFTLLTTLATISLNLQKAFVEPILFADLARPERGDARRKLMLWAVVLGAAGVTGGLVVLYAYNRMARIVLNADLLLQYGALSALSLMLMLSQSAHFSLYARGKDRAVLRASLWGAAVGVPLALSGAKPYGGVGIAAGLAIGASVLWAGKALGVRKLIGEPVQASV